MKIFKRKLSNRLSGMCEAAKGKVCHCRCKGQFHGKSHVLYRSMEEQMFAEKKARGEDVTDTDIQELVKRVHAVMMQEAVVGGPAIATA